MKYKINILNRIESDIFGQYTGIYYGESVTVEVGGTYGSKIKLIVNSGDTITVNCECVKGQSLLFGPHEFEGIWGIYALNPARGATFTITKDPA